MLVIGPIRCYHSGPTWVDLGAMAMKGCSAFPKLQHHWNLTIRLFSCLVSYPGHSWGGVLPLWREAVGIFYSPSWLGKLGLWKNTHFSYVVILLRITWVFQFLANIHSSQCLSGAQFSSSGCFYQGHESDEPHWSVR